MSSQSATERELREEIAELRIRLEEAKETLRAIQYDEVDALVINTAQGNQVYTLQGQDAELNRFRGEILGQISDAVIVVDQQQYITYINAAAEEMFSFTYSQAIGRHLSEIVTNWRLHPKT